MPHELHTQLFIFVMLFGWGFALLAGDTAQRLVTLILIAGLLLTLLALPVSMAARFRHIEWGAAAVDALILASLMTVAHYYRSGWILWMTAFQFMMLLSHFPIVLRPLITSESYVASTALWSWLMMLLLIGATVRDCWTRRRVPTSTS